MKNTAKIWILVAILLASIKGQYPKSIDIETKKYNLVSTSHCSAPCGKEHLAEVYASSSNAKGNVFEKAKKEIPQPSRVKIKLDTVLVDTLFGKKVYFRIARKQVADPFGSEATDTTAERLDCVTERDSLIFTFRNKVDYQFYQFYRIPGKDSRKSYLLHIEQYPSAPPSGNSAVIIAPVSGSLRVLSPGEISFNGALPNFSQGKIDGPPDEVMISVKNGFFGIQVPIRVESVGDSSFLVIPAPKSVVLSKATALNFKLTSPPKKSVYQVNADLTLYLDLDRKKSIKVKTPDFEDFEARSVWILMRSKGNKHSLQDMLDSCADLENVLLEVRIGNKIGFILFEYFMKIGYEAVG